MRDWRGRIDRDRISTREGLIGRGGYGSCGGWLTEHSQWMWHPSVDLLTQTPQLMNQTWFLPVRRTPSLRLRSPEQSTPPLIFKRSFYLNANTAQRDFCQGDGQREILGKMERGKVKGETDKKKTVRKTLCSQDFNLSGVIVPLVEEFLSVCRPAGHERKNPNIQTTVHTVETFGQVQHRQTCHITFYPDIVLVWYIEYLTVVVFTWFLMQWMTSTLIKVSQPSSWRGFQLFETFPQL